jgi:hypothetical protein
MRSYLAGLTLSTAGSSPTFSVAPGVAADSTNVDMITLAAAMSKTTGAWAAGTGAGALDLGTIAINTFYHVFLIKNVSTGAVDVLISLSATNPTMPSGYTLARRIGSSLLSNTSSQWYSFSQNGDEVVWQVPFQNVNVSNLGTSVVNYAVSVPPGLKVNALIRGYIDGNTAGVTVFSPDESGITASNVPLGNFTGQSDSDQVPAGVFTLSVRTNTAQQICAVGGAAGLTFVVATYGFVDRRGKDN